MPVYGYRCENGHTFEVVQRMSDEPVAACEVCGAPVQRVFHPVAVHFKGSGFYTTDYGRKKGSGSETAPKKDSAEKKDSATKSETGSSGSDKSSSTSGSGSGSGSGSSSSSDSGSSSSSE
jgi:putative FmdB family regulatory protein